MVRVLANGDLVADDDPRVKSNATSGVRQPAQGSNAQFNNFSSAQDRSAPYQGQSTSVLDTINQRLGALGIPSWNIGSFVVDPALSVGALLSLVFFGFSGLLLCIALFFVFKYSGLGGQGGQAGGGGNNRIGGIRHDGDDDFQAPGPSRPGGSGAFSGAGHRLGQS